MSEKNQIRGWDVLDIFSTQRQLLSASLFNEMELHSEARGKSSIGTRNILSAFITSMRPSSILEIGAHIGSATVIMGAALKENNFGMLYSLEPQNHYFKLINEFITKAQLSSYVTVLQKYSTDHDLTEIIPKKIDMIFLDANHSYSYAVKDLEIAASLLSENGLIFLDDVGSEMSPSMCQEKKGGVRKALIDFLATNLEFTGIFLEHPFWLNPCGLAIVCKQKVVNQIANVNAPDFATQLTEANKKIRSLEDKYEAILESTSWKITAPFRTIRPSLKKLFNILRN